MDEQRSPNSKSRVFDDLRNSLFLTKDSISFDVDRAVGGRLDEIIDELCDHLPDDLREKLTRARLYELCLTALVDEYEKNKSDSLFVRVTENFRRAIESE